MKQTVAQVLVRYLKEREVRHIFGVAGHSTFDILDAIYQEPGVSFLPAQSEIGAGYMANGYARGTRQISVNLVSSGAGATNAATGVAQAYKESYPVLTISSEVDREMAGKGASSWHEVPQREMFAPLTKLSISLNRAEDVLEVMEDAFSAVTTGRPGPAYVGIPRDLQIEEIEVPPGPWAGGHSTAAPPPDTRLVSQAVELLRRAQAPIVIAGGGVHMSNCEAEVLELAELLGAPVGATPSNKGIVSENHPLAVGILGGGAAPFANRFCQESDVILAVGTTFSEPLTLGYGNRVIPEAAKIVQVDVDPSEIGRLYPVEVGIAHDARAALQALIAQLKTAGHTPAASATTRVERMQEEKRALRAEMVQRGQPADGPITNPQIYHALRAAIDDDAVIVAEGGTQQLIQHFVATALVSHGGEFRAIGSGISTAMGLKCALPDKQVLCVSGDGSFMMEMQELATAMQSNLPVVTVVVRNEAYGNMKRDQIRNYGGRVIGTELHVPDLLLLAQSFGAYGARVERSADLVSTIRGALAANKPALVDVVCPI